MARRKEGADPSMDVGKWKHVEHVDPYHTWEKDLPNGGVAQVLFGDTGPQSEYNWWAHIEYRTNGSFEWSGDVLPAGHDRQATIRETISWMRTHQDWQPSSDGDLGFGMDGTMGGGPFF